MSVALEFKERLEDFLANPLKYVSKLDDDALNRILDRSADRFKEALYKQFVSSSHGNTPSASGLGKCARALAYKYHKFEGLPLTAQTRMTFLTGDLLEAAIYVIAELAGWQVLDIQAHMKVDEINGSIDGKADANTLVDIKTSSKAAFQIAERNGVSDDFGYLTQISLYKEGTQSEDAFFFYVCKDNGKFAVHEAPNAPDLVELAKRKYDFVLASTPDRLPPRPYTLVEDKKSKKSCLAFQCKFCDYRNLCWDITGVGEGYNKSEVYYATNPKQ